MEVLFANKEVLLAKLKLRLRLAFANLTERPRLWLELRLRLALAYRLSASSLCFRSSTACTYTLYCDCSASYDLYPAVGLLKQGDQLIVSSLCKSAFEQQ